MATNDMSAKNDTAGSIRILFLSADRFPPFRPAAKALFAGELPRRGHIVDWLVQADGPAVPAGDLPFHGGTAFVAPMNAGRTSWQRVLRYLQSYANALRMFTLLRRRPYAVLQVKDLYFGALLAIVAAKVAGVPLLYWLAFPHAETLLYAGKLKIARYPWLNIVRGTVQKWLLYRVILPASRHVFVQSEQMRLEIARQGIALEKMTPVPSSVNTAELTPAGIVQAKPAGERWIVYLGTLVRERQLDTLVRALPGVLARFPSARLVLVGAGELAEDEAQLLSTANSCGVGDRVTITGWLPMSEAWSYARAADVCVSPITPLPIFDVGSPTKLVEYMALGKPVVANHHPEQTPVIQQSGAGVLCHWDADGFAAAIVDVLGREPADAAALGAAGRRFVEEHRTHARLADVVEGAYRQVLTEQGSKFSVRAEASE
jgi:glycosyltransferase involved in cell wall biosynthesis